ncbi:bacteriophage holin [Patescibacteria group bacterium]
MKLSPKALGLALGITTGLGIAVMTLLTTYTGYLQPLTDLLIGVYPYYEMTLTGAIAGLAWGFIDGMIGGLIIAWIYNVFAPGSAS